MSTPTPPPSHHLKRQIPFPSMKPPGDYHRFADPRTTTQEAEAIVVKTPSHGLGRSHFMDPMKKKGREGGSRRQESDHQGNANPALTRSSMS